MNEQEDVGYSNVSEQTDLNIPQNTSLDLLEQQQAIEQARLLNRFKELRTWQQRQQEQLMLQQQEQLEILREEQDRVQSMLKQQRQQQWGAGTVRSGRTIRNDNGDLDQLNTMIPGFNQHNGIPTVDPQSSLPKPIIFEELSNNIEDDNYTNPDLFSNPGSVDQFEDGVYHHAYDTGSEISHPSSAQQLTLQTLLKSTSPETLKAMLAMIPRSQLMGGDLELPGPPQRPQAKKREFIGHGVSPRSKLRESALDQSPKGKIREIKISPRQRLNKSPSPRSSGSVIAELERREQPVIGNINQNGKPGSPRQHERVHFNEPELPQDVKRHLFYDDDDDKDSIDTEILETLNKMNCMNLEYNKPEVNNSEEQYKEEHRIEEGPRETPQFSVSIDDRPIKPGLAGKKTFEQLLEEQLMEEERQALAEAVVESPQNKKKPFLRRGQGLARFMGNNKAKESKPNRTANVKTKQVDSRPVNKQPDKTTSKQPDKTSSKENKQPDKPITKDKRKNDPSAGPLSNTAKSNQVSKPPGFKPKTNQSVPKTTSNPLVLPQTLTLNSNKNLLKTQTISSALQKSSVASNIQSSTNKTNNTSSVPQSNSQTVQQFKVPTIPNQAKELKATATQAKAPDPFDDDSSFAEVVRKRIANEGQEQEELDEFELLEDFADNASFCSNSSIVVKLLQNDKTKKSGEPLVGLKNILVARQKEKIEKIQANKQAAIIKEMNKVDEAEEDKDDTIVDQNIEDLSSDTLTDSDSSVSSDSDLDEDIKLLTAKLNLNKNNAFTNNSNHSGANSTNAEKHDSAMDPVPSKSLTRKIASRDGISSGSSISASTADMRSLLQRLTASKGPHMNNLLPKEGLRAAIDNDKKAVESDSEESTSEESSEEEDEEQTEVKKIDFVPDFDDEKEWTESTSKTKSVVNDNKAEAVSPAPPTSRLVARLFQNLNPQQPTEKQLKQQEAEKLQATKTSDGIQSKILRDKLAELEKEIERFRNENSILDRLRKDREEGLSKLKKEIADFEREKSDELNRLEEFKNQEMKKLKHERKMFEKYQKTIRNMPDKKDREEIDSLKNQLNELQDELKKKETRWASSQTRLKDKLELVELENKELKEEIKLLEKKRIEWMQKEAASSQKVMVNGHQSYPRSSTPTQETEEKHPDNTSNQISPRSHVPQQKKSVVNQIKYQTASKSLSLTTDSLPTLHMSTGDPHPRVEPTKIARSSEKESFSSNNATLSTSTTLPRKLASRLLLDNPTIDKGNKQFEESQHVDGKVERIYKNGAREISFSNGTRKEISSDGQSIVVSFFNGDIKQIFPDKRVVYYYSDAQTSHTTYPDSLEVLQFQNGQIEKHYPDGTKEITFPDQTVKYLFPNGSEESIFPDGTVIRVDTNGDKTMEFPNGQREIHNLQFKRREYPDGTVKTVYPDGRQETRYSTGRLRLKDKDGNVIMDKFV